MNALQRMLRRRHGTSARPAAATRGVGTSEDQALIARAAPFTMTGEARIQALVDAVRYCTNRGLPGAFVECGVWRGGSVLAMILALQELGVRDRDIYLYDTFEGMTEPTEHDVAAEGERALDEWRAAGERSGRPWEEMFGADVFSEEAVRETILNSGYPAAHVHVVTGPVEETIPGAMPEEAALLRLDTDWYESTLHELEHLYPRLADGGVLIIDDYGHWEGARRAVDEYFSRHPPVPLLTRIDYTGRIAIKA